MYRNRQTKYIGGIGARQKLFIKKTQEGVVSSLGIEGLK